MYIAYYSNIVNDYEFSLVFRWEDIGRPSINELYFWYPERAPIERIDTVLKIRPK